MTTTSRKKAAPKAVPAKTETRSKRVRKPAAAKAQPPAPTVELVRERFSMPQADFDRIAELKARARKLGRPAKKNELLRAGLQALSALGDEQLLLALDQLEPVKKAKVTAKS